MTGGTHDQPQRLLPRQDQGEAQRARVELQFAPFLRYLPFTLRDRSGPVPRKVSRAIGANAGNARKLTGAALNLRFSLPACVHVTHPSSG